MRYTKDIMKSPKFSIGDYTYGTITIFGEVYLDKLNIGKFCSIGPRVSILVKGYHHNPNAITTYPLGCNHMSEWPIIDIPRSHQHVTIGNDVWIGQDVRIMSNVTIGDGAILGTNALVTKDVEPYTIVGGNPAKVIRKRFSDKDIDTLLKVQWWNWDKAKIHRNTHLLYGSNIQDLPKAK